MSVDATQRKYLEARPFGLSYRFVVCAIDAIDADGKEIILYSDAVSYGVYDDAIDAGVVYCHKNGIYVEV